MLTICVMTDNPNSPTGMARVGKEIAMAFVEAGHNVCFIGWHANPPEQKKFPFKVYGCRNDLFGADTVDQVWQKEQFDILVTIGDIWRLDYLSDYKRCKTRRFFQWVSYSAIDGEPYGGGVPKFLWPIYTNPDKLVVYTDYAKEAIKKSMPQIASEVEVLYHGVDPNIFHPLPEARVNQYRKEIGTFGKFVFLVVSRNQPRKNIPEIFKAWVSVSADKDMETCMLWPHMHFNDPAGIPIEQILEVMGFKDKPKKNICYYQHIANAQTELHLLKEEDLNLLYNSCDALVMAGSEGFGLPTLEAMACKKPVIALDHSASKELIADGRGFPVKVAYEVTGRWMHERPFPDIKNFYEQFKAVFSDKDKRDKVAEDGYRFAQQHSWQSKKERWKQIINELEFPLSQKEIVMKEVA